MISNILASTLWLLLSFQPSARLVQSTSVVTTKSAAGTTSARTLTYVMRGEVRFLFFWVGRDNVGGGRISLSRDAENTVGQLWEEAEVLFGSNPERVPGKVNMWGYGKERTCWKLTQGGGQELVQSVFEGFMRPRDEFPADMQDYTKARKGQGSFLYKAVRSEVNEKEATTEIRFFVEKEDFNYRAPERLIRKYRQSISSTPPEIRRELPRQAANYETPAGFLTAAQSLVTRISDQAARNPKGWTGFRPSTRYAFHAKPYLLSVRKIRSAENFQAPFIGKPGAVSPIAEVDFRISNVKDAMEDDFTLWFALDGPMQGLPLRIVYQPKWWLRLRLDLTKVMSDEF